MRTRRLAFRVAGALWLVLGVLSILTVFGTAIGVFLAWFVGVQRNVLAARVGAVLGVLLFVPGQLILDIAGCRREACSAEPYLLAYALPAVVTGLNLYAGWPAPRGLTPSTRPDPTSAPAGPSPS